MRRKILQPKIYVYRNLNRKIWSVKYRGLVIAHTPTAFMWDVEFKVNEAGRQRVLKEGVKNVHAYAVCALEDLFLPRGAELFTDDLGDSVMDCTDPLGGSLDLLVRYEPKRRGSFLERTSGRNIYSASHVYLTARGGLRAQKHFRRPGKRRGPASDSFRPRVRSSQRKAMSP